MKNLLISEPPLQVLPSLAVELDNVDKAIILQQIHYWCSKSNKVKDGYRWVYNSVTSWHEQFPWISEKTIQRYLKDLERKGLLITGVYNKAPFDKTKWYRINYEALDNLGEPMGLAVPTNGIESPLLNGTESPNQYHRLPETTTETNNNMSDNKSDQKEKVDYGKFIEWFNQKTGKRFKNVESNRKIIRARINEGYSKSELAKVVEFKSKQWKDDPKMNPYLRITTIFAPSHFGNYLNEANGYSKSSNISTTTTSDGQRAGKSIEEIEAERANHLKKIEERAREKLNEH